jgi:lysyl-tRNA synthetase class 2
MDKTASGGAEVTEGTDALAASDYRELRIRRIEELERKDKAAAYPHKYHVTMSVANFCKEYATVKTDEVVESVVVSIAGRIVFKRESSKKLYFYKILDEISSVQVLANYKYYTNKDDFTDINDNTLRRGDIIGVRGHPARSKTGELSIVPLEITLLAPCIRMLPHPGTLTDLETRHRQRHLDGIVNREQVYNNFVMRHKIISFIRKFFDDRGFIHVETPTMSLLPGGAQASPFITYHNDLNMNMFMRISPELDLKKCIIAGFNKVYEIGRNYRNESADLTHNPEFTAIETYEAYADYEDLMKMAEELLSSMVLTLFGKYTVNYKKSNGEEVVIDFTPPFKRYPMIETLEQKMNVKFPIDLGSSEAEKIIKGFLDERAITLTPPYTTTRMIDKLVGEFIEGMCTNPSFITEHPQLMCPLAKYHRSKPGLTERFELFVLGKELCNAYTELNNPIVQKKLFEDQQKDRDAGDDEAMPIDTAFVEAMECGLVCTGGFGLGIDRLVMFLTNNTSIREVILFPANRATELERQAQAQMKRVFDKSLKRADLSQ